MMTCQSTTKARRAVRFGDISTHTVEPIPDHHKKMIWYSSNELHRINCNEIYATKEVANATTSSMTSNGGGIGKRRSLVSTTAANSLLNQSLERHNLSWRGIENIQKGYKRSDKNSYVIDAVMTEYLYQLQQFGCFDPEELRIVSKMFSKSDRVKAQKLAQKDAQEAKKYTQDLIEELAANSSSSSLSLESLESSAELSPLSPCKNTNKIFSGFLKLHRMSSLRATKPVTKISMAA